MKLPAIPGVLVAALFLLAFPAAGASTADLREWKFRVLLNDDEIGFHNFRLESSNGLTYLDSQASFDVRVLFFTAYRYRHSNRETWSGSCLESIESDTNANGKPVKVTGQREADGFVVEAMGEAAQLDDCVMSFAYWNPNILQRSRLLNAQTGEYLDVDIQPQPDETLVFRGAETLASRYRISGRDLRIDLWYSAENEWLALESLAKGGRIIRYERT